MAAANKQFCIRRLCARTVLQWIAFYAPAVTIIQSLGQIWDFEDYLGRIFIGASGSHPSGDKRTTGLGFSDPWATFGSNSGCPGACLGVGFESADANFQFIKMQQGVEPVRIDTGISRASVLGQVLDLEFQLVSGATKLSFQLKNVVAGTTLASAILDLPTELPPSSAYTISAGVGNNPDYGETKLALAHMLYQSQYGPSTLPKSITASTGGGGVVIVDVDPSTTKGFRSNVVAQTTEATTANAIHGGEFTYFGDFAMSENAGGEGSLATAPHLIRLDVVGDSYAGIRLGHAAIYENDAGYINMYSTNFLGKIRFCLRDASGGRMFVGLFAGRSNTHLYGVSPSQSWSQMVVYDGFEAAQIIWVGFEPGDTNLQ